MLHPLLALKPISVTVGICTAVVLMAGHWVIAVLRRGRRLHRLVCYSIGMGTIGVALEVRQLVGGSLDALDFWTIAIICGIGTVTAWGIDALAELLRTRDETEVRRTHDDKG